MDCSARRTRDHQRSSPGTTPSTQRLQSAANPPNRDNGVTSWGGYDRGGRVQEQSTLIATPPLQRYGLFQSPAMYQSPDQDPNTGGLSGSQRRGIYTEDLSFDEIASRVSGVQHESPAAQTSQSQRRNPSYENGSYFPDMDRIASCRRPLPTLRSNPQLSGSAEQDLSGMLKESSEEIFSKAMKSSWRLRPRTNTNPFGDEPPAGSHAEASQRSRSPTNSNPFRDEPPAGRASERSQTSRPRTGTNLFGDEPPTGSAALGGGQDKSPLYNQLSALDRSPSSDFGDSIVLSGLSEMARRGPDRRRLRRPRSILQLSSSADQDLSRPYSQLSIQEFSPSVDARVPSGFSEMGRRGPTRIDLENWRPTNLKPSRTSQLTLGNMNQVSPRDDAKSPSNSSAVHQKLSHTSQFAPAGPNRPARQGLFANHGAETMEVEGYDSQRRQLALLEGHLVYFGNLERHIEDSHLYRLLWDFGVHPVSVRVYSYSGSNYCHLMGLIELETTETAIRVISEFDNQPIREMSVRVRLALPSDGLPVVAKLQSSSQADCSVPISAPGQSPNTFDEFNGQLHKGRMGGLGRNAAPPAQDVVNIPHRVHVGGLSEHSTPRLVNDIFIKVENRVVKWGPLRPLCIVDGQLLLTSFADFRSEQEAQEVYESCAGDVNCSHLKFWVSPATSSGL